MKDIQQGFAPFSRMCLRNIKTKGVPIVEFTCISWHGKHKMSLEGKKQEFESMLKYISEIWRETSLPVILAGDFNLEIKDIETLVSPPLVLHKYTPTERRKLNTIDFYISSKSLTMSDPVSGIGGNGGACSFVLYCVLVVSLFFVSVLINATTGS
jgi:hypothetical protein